MNAARRTLNVLNSLVDAIVALALLLAALYSVYALWDNKRVYTAADQVQSALLRLKPETGTEQTGSASFAQLREINPEICAWLTLDHTKIDYPILQGRDNLSYINTDAYGNFALAGSIFLDARNSSAFQDTYSLLYGHHMDHSRMFGDLDLYKDEAFFADNSTGVLILPDRAFRLEIFACLVVSASEATIFDPQRWQADADCAELLDYAARSSPLVRSDTISRILASDAAPQILAMSTCASEFTDARTVVLAVMEPSPEIQEGDNL